MRRSRLSRVVAYEPQRTLIAKDVGNPAIVAYIPSRQSGREAEEEEEHTRALCFLLGSAFTGLPSLQRQLHVKRSPPNAYEPRKLAAGRILRLEGGIVPLAFRFATHSAHFALLRLQIDAY